MAKRKPKPLRLSRRVKDLLMAGKRQGWVHSRLKQQGGKCRYCQKPLRREDATADHAVPLSKGGEDHYENVVAACFPCNQKKGDSVQPIDPAR